MVVIATPLNIARSIFHSALSFDFECDLQYCKSPVTFNLSTEDEVYGVIKQCYNRVLNGEFSISGPGRRNDWAVGWSGSGVRVDPYTSLHVPFYFGKSHEGIRLDGRLFKASDPFAELLILRALHKGAMQYFQEHFNKDFALAEYGCGTGHNLIIESTNREVFGYDWVDTAFNSIKESCRTISLEVVDFFDESTFVSPNKPYVVFTNDALEQCGHRYAKFMESHFANPHCLGGIHFEPVPCESSSLLHQQSNYYHAQRAYLSGFTDFLGIAKALRRIDNFVSFPTQLGSIFMFSHHVCIWSASK